MSLFPRLAIAPPETTAWSDQAAARRRIQGDLAHQALALVKPDEADSAAVMRRLQQARALLGLHPATVDLAPLAASIVRSLAHPDIAPFFTSQVLALPEQEVVVPQADPAGSFRLLRMDRLVLLPDDTLWVLDFKLGPGLQTEDMSQIREYQRLAANIFGHPCHGLLVHLDQPRTTCRPAVVPDGRPPRSQGRTLSIRDIFQVRGPDPTPSPIEIFPLHDNLLERLRTELLAGYKPDNPLHLAQASVIFPHRRPKIHLLQSLARSLRRSFLPPTCQGLEDWILRQACLCQDIPPALADPLDQAWLLFNQHQRNAPDNTTRNALPAWHQFLPWGLRLAQVMEELDRELIVARNLELPPEELPALAQNLMARMGNLQEGFHAALSAHTLTTKSLLARNVPADRLDLNSKTYVCGLFALTRSEAALIQALRDRGARIWWQADRPLPDQLARWAKDWQAPVQWHADKLQDRPDQAMADPPRPPGKTTFIQAHDLHSQLRHLASDIESWDDSDTIAVILPEPSLLRPLLAHMPRTRQVNITLGMPLERTTLGALFNLLGNAARDKQIAGTGPDASTLFLFFQDPWIRGLLPQGMSAWLRQVLAETMHKNLNQEDLDRLSSLAGQRFGHADNRFFDLCSLFVEALDLGCLADLAGFLRRLLASLRIEQTGRPPLEMHVVHALLTEIIPAMEHALCNRLPLPGGSLWNVFWTALRAERVPFSGEPLTPWQVMGLLESRLLCFDKVVVLECLEGTLPSPQVPNPLLPEALRPVLGLPPGYTEEQIVRHHLLRLEASAREVRLYSRQGLAPDPLDGRVVPSRYWEQALWEMEKACGRRLDEQIERVALHLSLESRRPEYPHKEKLLPLLRDRLARGLSPSALNTYLTCPTRFFFEQVALFPARPDPDHDAGARIMGELAHKVLEDLFRPRLMQRIAPRDLLAALPRVWDECAARKLRDAPLSAASRFFHTRLLRELLHNYLAKGTQPVFVLMLEQTLQRPLPGLAQAIVLRGRLDRVDQDQETGLPLILDYKTGAAPLRHSLSAQNLWELTEDLRTADMDRAWLIQVKEQLQDVQLPAYLYLLARPALCGFQLLGEWDAKKAFVPLLKRSGTKDGQEALAQYLRWQEEGLPVLMEWLGRHILEAPFFYPACVAQSCAACPWGQVCLWADVG